MIDVNRELSSIVNNEVQRLLEKEEAELSSLLDAENRGRMHQAWQAGANAMLKLFISKPDSVVLEEFARELIDFNSKNPY